jgi:spore maturation protein CgeB
VKLVFLGLSIGSSWGNGHATNYRALCRALADRGHDVLFLERDVAWYRRTRDFEAPFALLYESLHDLHERFADDVAAADLVVVGSFVPEGIAVGEWALATAGGAVAFWDIDTPVTVAQLERGDCTYLTRELAARYDLYLSFTGGPLLQRLGARLAVPFHCLVDPRHYRPADVERRYALGYLGTYSPDRQPTVERLLLEPARRLRDERFVVAGPEYPDTAEWPGNVESVEHVAPDEHAAFYGSQRLTLNVTRAPMLAAGWSPSVRLFEAAACAVAVLTDRWPGLESFFTPGEEILVAETSDDALRYLTRFDADELAEVGRRARARVLADHTAERRAEQLEQLVGSLVAAA